MRQISHLERAITSALDAAPSSWMSRADLDRALSTDRWVSRNMHRLARLDFTLANMAREGRIEILDNDGSLRRAPSETYATIMEMKSDTIVLDEDAAAIYERVKARRVPRRAAPLPLDG
jgi:hypothetical protein